MPFPPPGLRTLASRGFVVAVADYRVYPDVTLPAFVEDAAAAVAWVRRNARRYGGYPSRLVVAGQSAGHPSRC